MVVVTRLQFAEDASYNHPPTPTNDSTAIPEFVERAAAAVSMAF